MQSLQVDYGCAGGSHSQVSNIGRNKFPIPSIIVVVVVSTADVLFREFELKSSCIDTCSQLFLSERQRSLAFRGQDMVLYYYVGEEVIALATTSEIVGK